MYPQPGNPQPAKLFEKEIVERMGRGFHRQVFAPTIRRAIQEGEGYVEIRDRIRKAWKL